MHVNNNLLMSLARIGDLAAARQLGAEIAEDHKSPAFEADKRIYFAQVELLDSCPSTAVEHIDRALQIVAPGKFPELFALAQAVRAQALLSLDRSQQALSAAHKGMSVLEQLDVLDEGDALLRLVYAQALHAQGRVTEARRAIAAARDRILTSADEIDDPAWRHSFLDRVVENRYTLELADAWLPGDECIE